MHELGADHLIFDGVGERGVGRDFHNSLTDIKRCIARYCFLSVCSCAIFLKFKCPIFLGILPFYFFFIFGDSTIFGGPPSN